MLSIFGLDEELNELERPGIGLSPLRWGSFHQGGDDRIKRLDRQRFDKARVEDFGSRRYLRLLAPTAKPVSWVST